MLIPYLTARVKKFDDLSGHIVYARQVGSFMKIAIDASQRQI